MEKSHQELILEKHKTFDAVVDCFAISRIEKRISSLSKTAGFNDMSRDKIAELYGEFSAILEKYKDAIQVVAKGYEWLSAGGKAWVQGQVGLPVEVDVTGVDWDDERAEIKSAHQELKLPFNRLYETEEACPCR